MKSPKYTCIVQTEALGGVAEEEQGAKFKSTLEVNDKNRGNFDFMYTVVVYHNQKEVVGLGKSYTFQLEEILEKEDV